jgi:hypothetical protein
MMIKAMGKLTKLLETRSEGSNGVNFMILSNNDAEFSLFLVSGNQ